MENTLYYGDNLDIPKRYVNDESVDLIYLDPPFNSSQNYNVLFKEKDGAQAVSQIQAFAETWTWGQDDESVYAELVMAGGKVADVMQAFRTFLVPCDMLAYGSETGYEQFKIGVLLRQAREQAGLTQEQLATRMRTKRSAISRIENHAENIGLATVEKHAAALGKRVHLSVS